MLVKATNLDVLGLVAFPADCMDEFFSGFAPGDFVLVANVSSESFYDVFRAEITREKSRLAEITMRKVGNMD
jgi:hypothetical protein